MYRAHCLLEVGVAETALICLRQTTFVLGHRSVMFGIHTSDQITAFFSIFMRYLTADATKL
jgi:hypothetical protein